MSDDDMIRRGDAIAAANARADRAEAERAAQIEADAALVQEYEARLAKWEMQNGTHMSPYEALAEATAAIRTQPHDRTALDRLLAEARAQVLRDAAGRVDAIILAAEDANLNERKEGLRDAHNAITRMIDKPIMSGDDTGR